ncbi:MAG TPA: hypothetical protein PLJ21_01585 [Pseudobdellovibrionaceae bacterium]|nr:hypothetical protein [Pseudobdellovibrionaceae bacterium]
MFKSLSKGLSFFIFLFLISACSTKKTEISEDKYKVIQVSAYGSDFTLPEKIWDLLLAGDDTSHKTESVKNPKKNETTLNTFFSEMQVTFVEKTPGVLKDSHLLVKFPKGGGYIDLSQYQTGQQGSYFIKLNFPMFQEATQKKVIFFSRSKKRRVGSLVLGSGCNTYYDITNQFFKNMDAEGLVVNTTRHRDVSLLAGHFIFLATLNGQNYISQVRFGDSVNSYLECGDEI